jgi:plasmid maintenance system antidote protein VapI
MSTLSDNIRIMVHELDISQTDFAKSIGVTFNYVNMLINGKRHSMSYSLALLIQELFGYSINWILYNKGEKRLDMIKTPVSDHLKEMIHSFASEDIIRVYEYIAKVEHEEARKRKYGRMK